jgi:hypothetical protein
MRTPWWLSKRRPTSEPQRYARRLRCEECAREPHVEGHAAGWVAYLVDLADDPEPPLLVVYCPECAAQDFG